MSGGWGRYAAALLLLMGLALLAPTAAAAEQEQELDIWALAAEAFPEEEVEKAVRVARCESNFQPGATAEGWDRRYGYYRYVGLWQIDPYLHSWRARRQFGPDADLYDPRVNAHVAAEILRESGWRAWPYCSRYG